MSNELTVVLITLAALALSYLWIYPKFAGNDPKRLAWLDVLVGVVVFGIVAILFWQSDPVFRFIFFDTNWFVFGLLTYVVLEVPLFMLYLKARKMSFSEMMFGTRLVPKGSPDAGWATASLDQVKKQLNDTKWDGLRTPSARKGLVLIFNLVFIASTAVLWFFSETIWPLYSLIHILVLFVFWFLLRQSTRLITEGPVEALDERLHRLRDAVYVSAYRGLALVALIFAAAIMFYAVFADLTGLGTDGFTYSVAVTWPQVQALFWFIWGYALLIPSMVMAWHQAKEEAGLPL